MLKIVAAGVTALFITVSPLAYAQTPAQASEAHERLSEADLSALTDARIHLVKAALQLTPDQEKFWPPIEAAIRERARDRQARIAAVAARLREQRERSPIDVLRDRDPVEFLQRRSGALAQRAADLKKLADAWQPLYPTLSPEQKRRMAALAIFVIRELRSDVEHRRLQSEDHEEE